MDFIELSGGTYEELAFHHKRESTKAREGPSKQPDSCYSPSHVLLPAFFSEFADIIRPSVKTSKLCITGGFRTASGMISAVSSNLTTFVGLGRPTCEEPDIGKLILSGKVPSARASLVPPNDDIIATVCGGMQIMQMGYGERPFSTASVENMGKLQGVVGKWMKEMGQAAMEGRILAGYPYAPGAFA